MALINKTDFSIIYFNDDEKTQNDYFECDDLIAPAISLLNKKGYKTKFCCSGHPYANIEAAYTKDYPKAENDILLLRVEKSENVQNEYKPDSKEYPYYVIYKTCYCNNNFYISFEKDYEFSNLPGDAFIDSNPKENFYGIYWILNGIPTDNFDLMEKFYEMNKSFYKWVENLPSLI